MRASSPEAIIVPVPALAQYLTALFWSLASPQAAASPRFFPVLRPEGHPAVDTLAARLGSEPWDVFRRRLPPHLAGEDPLWLWEAALSSEDGARRARIVRALLQLASETHASRTAPDRMALQRALTEGGQETDAPPLAPSGDAVAARNDSFLWVAAVFAHQHQRPLWILEDWSELPQRVAAARPRTVALVAEPGAFPVRALDSLLRLGRSGSPGPALGILTARTLPSLTRLLLKATLYPQVDFGSDLAVVDIPLSSPPQDAMRVLAWEALTPEELQRLTRDPVGVLALTSHGDNIDADLNRSVLCGKVSRLPARSTPTGARTHTCLTDDFCRRNARQANLLMPIDRLQCQVLFNEACSGISVSHGIFPDELSLALGALEGWAGAYIASLKIVRTTKLAPLLLPVLLRSGYTLGEATRWLGAFHETLTGDVPSYLLLGDPAARLQPRSNPDEGSLQWPASHPVLPLELENLSSALVRIELTGTHAQECVKRGAVLEVVHVEREEGGGQPPAFGVGLPSPSGEGLSLLLFSSGPLGLRKLALRVRPASGSPSAASQEARSVERNLSLLRSMHEKIRKADGLRDTPELRKQAVELGEVLELAGNALYATLPSLREREQPIVPLEPLRSPEAALLAPLRTALEKADALFARCWLTWRMPHYIAPFYDGPLRPEGREQRAADCYLCGSQVFEISMRSPLRSELGRTVSHCARCGIISDRPEGEPLTEVRGPGECRVGEPVLQELYVSNVHDQPQVFSACVTVEGTFPWFRYAASPSSPTFTVPAQGTGSQRFEFVAEPGSAPGLYYLITFAVHHLGFHVNTKPLMVRR